MAKNSICHIEFESTDLSRSQAFFEAMFEWKFQSFGDSMVIFGLGDTHLGGLSKVETVRCGGSPSVWIEVDDLEAQMAKAPTVGGGVQSSKQPVPGVGWSAQINDPDGNFVGLVQFDR